jgi:hypothetical protein
MSGLTKMNQQQIIVHRTATSLDIITTTPVKAGDIDKIIKQLESEGHVCRKVAVNKLPTDLTYERAWFFNDDLIVPIDINPNSAKEILRNRWREARTPILRELDTKYMKALEKNDTAAMTAVSVQKQKLRDITMDHSIPDRMPSESIDAYSKRLSACWPRILQQ